MRLSKGARYAHTAAGVGAEERKAQEVAALATRPESGTKDKNYDLVTVTQLCLEHVWRLDQYAQDADREGDEELATLFRRMQEHSRRGGEECKRLLKQRLDEEGAGPAPQAPASK